MDYSLRFCHNNASYDDLLYGNMNKVSVLSIQIQEAAY